MRDRTHVKMVHDEEEEEEFQSVESRLHLIVGLYTHDGCYTGCVVHLAGIGLRDDQQEHSDVVDCN